MDSSLWLQAAADPACTVHLLHRAAKNKAVGEGRADLTDLRGGVGALGDITKGRSPELWIVARAFRETARAGEEKDGLDRPAEGTFLRESIRYGMSM